MYSRKEYLERINKRGLNLADLCQYIITQWKKVILLSMIIFIGLSIGIVYKHNIKKNANMQSVSMEQLNSTQQMRVTNALRLHNELINIDEYARKSEYMQLNAYNDYIYFIQYFVTASNESNQRDAYELYANYVENGILKQQLEKELGTQINNPSELVSLSDISMENKAEDKLRQNVLCIKINATDQDTAKKIATVIMNCLDEYKNSIVNKLMSDHELQFISESFYSGVDYEVKKNQDDIDTVIGQKKNQLTDLENSMSDDEKALYEKGKLNDGSEENSKIENEKSSLCISLISALLLSIFVALGLYGCYFIVNNRVKSSQEITEIFDIPLIGEIVPNSNTGDNLKVCKEIELLCKSRNINEVFVSCVDKMENKYDIETIVSNISDVQVSVGSNICYSVESMERAKKEENIIAIIKYYSTSYKSLAEFFQKCDYLNINIVGAISIK